MSQSPGHREHPSHRVREQPISQRIRAAVNGDVIAESTAFAQLDTCLEDARLNGFDEDQCGPVI